MTTSVLGSQWGDEGKGKLADMLCGVHDYCARFNGGSNAGHTLKVDGKTFALHLLPSGVINPKCINVIGNGVVVHIPTLFKEIDGLEKQGISLKDRLFISQRAHIVFDFHQSVDGLNEAGKGGSKLGTTKRGIGPCYADKADRIGIRMIDMFNEQEFERQFRSLVKSVSARFGDVLSAHPRKRDAEGAPSMEPIDVDAELQRYREYAKRLQPMVTDTITLMNEAIGKKKRVLLEGANATMLDLDYGTYPFVTSSHPSIGGAAIGLGIAPRFITDVFGVVKAYTTRVGAGPFPTEDLGSSGEHFGSVGHEFGTTTGRSRRCGHLDLVVVAYAHRLNHFTALNLTKLDVLTGLKELRVCTAYELNGKRLPLGSFPASLVDLSAVSCVYETLPGWSESLSGHTSFKQLPKNAQEYVRFIEKILDVHIKWIGVGPGREELIVREKNE